MKSSVTSLNKMSFLGIDLGASFVKGAVLDPGAASIRSVVRVPFPDFVKGLLPGHREVEPGAILAAFRDVLDRLLTSEPDPEGLVLCSQMHGFIFTDDRGRALSNFHSWQDERAGEIDPQSGSSFFDEMRARLTERDEVALGREVRGGHPGAQLFRLARLKRLPEKACTCSLPDFILAEACGQRPVTEATMASAHGLFHVEKGAWHDEVLAKWGLPIDLLPRVVPTGSRVGIMEWRGKKIPCYTPVGDQQCALLGVGLRRGELSLNIATGSQASQRVDSTEPGNYQVRPYFGGDFLRTITHIPAGRSLNAMLRLFSELGAELEPDEIWRRVLTRVDEIPATDARVDLSFFPGAFGSEGATSHLREDNLTAGHLFLAALENMAGNYARAAGQLNPAGTWTNLVLSGGIAQKIPRLRALIQREIPCAQRLSISPDDTLQGLLILGSLWSGNHGDLDSIQSRVVSAI
jgi:sedoheptulokinase